MDSRGDGTSCRFGAAVEPHYCWLFSRRGLASPQRDQPSSALRKDAWCVVRIHAGFTKRPAASQMISSGKIDKQSVGGRPLPPAEQGMETLDGGWRQESAGSLDRRRAVDRRAHPPYPAAPTKNRRYRAVSPPKRFPAPSGCQCGDSTSPLPGLPLRRGPGCDHTPGWRGARDRPAAGPRRRLGAGPRGCYLPG